jgi:hypothetical protein
MQTERKIVKNGWKSNDIFKIYSLFYFINSFIYEILFDLVSSSYSFYSKNTIEGRLLKFPY